MYLLTVTPIARGITKETLTYFSAKYTEPGTIIFVPLRKRTVPALVLSFEDVKDAKARVKSSDFSLKKVTSKRMVSFLPPQFIKAAEETARYCATTTGAVLHEVIPQSILEQIEKLAPSTESSSPSTPQHNTQLEKAILQADFSERIARYKGLIRESFARRISMMILVPTIADVERMGEALGRGISAYTFLFHSGLTKKELREQWKAAVSKRHPVLLIGTPSFISLFREDISIIILERESSSSYKLSHRPYLDLRLFIERYAQMQGIRLILADLPLRLETLFRYREHELLDIIPPKLRLLSPAEEKFIDMREEMKKPGVSFSVLSKEAEEIITRAVSANERCFLFVARRGLAPVTVCRDCGTTITAKDGETPMVLHKTPQGNMFVSHKTGEMRSAHERCRYCASWRLEALGIGIERVHESVSELVPDAPIVQIDRDTTNTHRKIETQIKKFYATEGSILLGTELAIPYLSLPIEHGIIVSTDSLLSLPEWRVSERVFSLIVNIRALAEKSMLVQTRKAGEATLKYALSGNIKDFYEEEINIRKEFKYPPFYILVKISCAGTSARVEHEMNALQEIFKDFPLQVYPGGVSKPRGREERHALLRIPRKDWPHSRIIEKLRSLAPHFAVDINPQNLL